MKASRSLFRLFGEQFPTIGVAGGGNLSLRITSWQNTQTDLVHIGGVPEAEWDGGTLGLAADYTAMAPAYACRQAGVVTQIAVYVNVQSGASWKVKFWRWNNGTELYDLVGESSFTPDATGAQTFAISPITVQTGDIPSIYAPVANQVRLGNANPAGDPLLSRYDAGDITSSNAFVSSGATNIKVDCRGTASYLCVTGDSIPEGHNGTTNYHGGLHALVTSKTAPGGTLTSEIGAVLRSKIGDGSVLKYQNLALGSQTFAWVASTGIVQCLLVKPHTVLIHCGVNDVSTGRSWEDVETDLDTIKTAVVAASPAPELLIDEILPWTAGSDGQAATIRSFNASLATWCSANGARLVICHDAMGQIRPTTGELDDLLTAYNQDDVHLTTDGVDALASIWMTYL
jgi:hypothetical protein